jgi:hypothetical protein
VRLNRGFGVSGLVWEAEEGSRTTVGSAEGEAGTLHLRGSKRRGTSKGVRAGGGGVSTLRSLIANGASHWENEDEQSMRVGTQSGQH